MTVFATTLPNDSLKIGYIPQWFRDVQIIIKALKEREHEDISGPMTASILGGEHKAGSAKVFFADAAPTNRPDGTTVLDSDDAGRLFWKSDDEELFVRTATEWVSVYDKFLALARTFADDLTVTGDLAVTGGVAVNTDKFTVATDTGNTVVAGTLAVTGKVTLGDDLDFNKNEANGMVLENLDAAGEAALTPVTGQIWFRTDV